MNIEQTTLGILYAEILAEFDASRAALAEKDSELAAQGAQIIDFVSQTNSLQAQIESLNSDLSATTTERDALSVQASDLAQAVSAARSTIENLQSDFDAYKVDHP